MENYYYWNQKISHLNVFLLIIVYSDIMLEEYRVWKGSKIIGKGVEDIEKTYDGIKIKAVHKGLYSDEHLIQFNTIEIGMFIVAEGERKIKKLLLRDTLPST